MKFRAHETFYIRKNWLSKGLKYVEGRPNVFTSKTENPMDVLGIGSNMVKSLRYWLVATGLTEESNSNNRRGQYFTAFAELVRKYDPYTEELGTLWMLHYNLIKRADIATSWFYFFNYFNLSEFTKEDFVNALSNYARLSGVEVPIRSAEDDFNCIVNTYLPRYKSSSGKGEPENNMECPLSELGLVDIQSKGRKSYKKIAPIKKSIPVLIALAVLVDNAEGRKEFPLGEIKNSECNLGKAFNLDTITLMAVLNAVESAGYIHVVRTAGLDVVRLNTDMNCMECLEKYYEGLN